MAGKTFFQISIITVSVLSVISILFLSRGFEITIDPDEIKTEVNSRLPVDFSIDTDTRIGHRDIMRQSQRLDCNARPGSTHLACHLWNLIVVPIQRIVGIIPAIWAQILERQNNITSVDARVERIGQLSFDDEGKIYAKGYVSAVGVDLPVDVLLKTQVNSETGVIEIASQPVHSAQEYLDKWELIIKADLVVFDVPIKFSKPRFRFDDEKMKLDESYTEEVDLKKHSGLFNFLRPFLKDIELDERGITLSYGL